MKRNLALVGFSIICLHVFGQQKGYWQQHVDYTMEIDVDVDK